MPRVTLLLYINKTNNFDDCIRFCDICDRYVLSVEITYTHVPWRIHWNMKMVKNVSAREQRLKNWGPWLLKRALSALAMHTWAECHIYLHLSQWICWKLSPLQFRALVHAQRTLQYTLRLDIIFSRLYSINPIWIACITRLLLRRIFF